MLTLSLNMFLTTALANMQAVTERFGTSVKAFLIVPIAGSMFADFINSLFITVFLNFIG